MKSLLLSFIFLLSIAAQASGALTPAQQKIVALEHQLNDALSRVDEKAISNLWAEDFAFVAPNGSVWTKAQRLASLPPANSSDNAVVSTVDDVSVKIFGQVAIALVRTSWRGTAEGKLFAEPYIATHVWVKEGNAWRLKSAHVAKVSVKPTEGGI